MQVAVRTKRRNCIDICTTRVYNAGTMDTNDKPKRILNFIIGYKERHNGVSPTLQEITDGANLSSKSLVNYYLQQLAGGGTITFTPGNARTIEVTGSRWLPPVWYSGVEDFYGNTD